MVPFPNFPRFCPPTFHQLSTVVSTTWWFFPAIVVRVRDIRDCKVTVKSVGSWQKAVSRVDWKKDEI